MFILHLDIVLKRDSGDQFVSLHREKFTPAISAQAGFSSTTLLKPTEVNADFDFRLEIAFTTQEAQLAWVATDVHQKVWSEMEAKIDKYTILRFDAP